MLKYEDCVVVMTEEEIEAELEEHRAMYIAEIKKEREEYESSDKAKELLRILNTVHKSVSFAKHDGFSTLICVVPKCDPEYVCHYIKCLRYVCRKDSFIPKYSHNEAESYCNYNHFSEQMELNYNNSM